ncbi:thioredoxin family protein [Verminephrobacter aporrectodeae]|uniref:thioredoxin family protein n=1 Tax=Verminephrobacter aporrectodeae TaxID=1110389 RepID=UPI0002377A89|nr:thioredoxin family protein [Verminephrobacter aporrectodeae]MCW8174934.1 thioredoxin [Verminephrobacter aporrectodeae subsp. tuberculatae]MCW8199685.1 thioredoxin [Verminephrobacter aporrectodeae subsp. tuberculatae]MCW8202954.1 thioredoxin [Verminephrobacter aporrectodeae subsp. tuberculatae]
MESPALLPDTLSAPCTQAGGGLWWVICLCPDWCSSCRSYRPLFDALARAHPGVRFEWVDIEDEAELIGDLDPQTFPTLLIGQGTNALFLGPLTPQAPVLARLLSSLQSGAQDAAHAQAQDLFQRVRAARTPSTS